MDNNNNDSDLPVVDEVAIAIGGGVPPPSDAEPAHRETGDVHSSSLSPGTGGDVAAKTASPSSPSVARPVVTSDIAPDVEIRYTDLCYDVVLSQAQVENEMPSVWRAFGRILSLPVTIATRITERIRSRGQPAKPAATRVLHVLDHVSGVIRPGTLTLVLAPPGHGKSAFLKALAQVLPGVQGTITYSGMSADAATQARNGVHLGQLVQYVSQLDEHLPYLTVRETLEFVHANACVDPAQFGHAELAEAHAAGLEDILTLLHLRNCMNTVIGNELLRGVSGGEKKRVTVGEGLLTNARVLALDEISTGLDSAVTYDIVARLKQRAVDGGMAVVVALLQPTPEVYGLFDEVVLLREGGVVYHGPRAALPGYLQGLGYEPPAEGGAQGMGKADLADWLVSFLNAPAATYLAGPGATAGGSNIDLSAMQSSSALATAAEAPKIPESLPTTTAALTSAWRGSELFRLQMSSPPAAQPLALTSAFAKAQYGHAYVHPVWRHVQLLMWRQFIVMRRNILYIRSRLVTAILMSIILGGLYYQRSAAQGPTLLGTMLNSCMLMSFTNFTEMASAVEFKYIAYKHVANGQHPAAAFPLSAAMAHIPVAIPETLIFSGILFGMSGMAASARNYFVYWATCFLVNIFMAAFMRVASYRNRTLQAAQAMPMPLIAIMIVFAGFLITNDKMPRWLFWINYIDIYGWALRTLAQNEFLSPKYDARPAGPNGPTLGEAYLRAFGFPVESEWLWGGLIFMAASAVGTVILSIWAFTSVRFDRNVGSARAAVEDTAHLRTTLALDRVSAISSQRAVGAVAAALPFQPMNVAFEGIRYTVHLPKHMGGGDKTLLHGITGYATPGRMLALMGASGAGKTTLLDVLASRKNSGKMEGTITLNGFAKEERTFNRITAYVEQQDIHMPLASVREALDFSAALRLPGSVSVQQRTALVDEVVRLLELGDLQDRKVGKPGEPDGLAPAERKHLTIGVELVSNAPVIFLDEPTSGLDSRAAANVMRTIRRVADTGRTVICTVHQPAADLFYQFDDLLLLQRGGYQVYFGPLGRRGVELVRFLEAVPTVKKCPRGVNVSSWMLETLALHGAADKPLVSPNPAGEKEAPQPLAGSTLHAAYFASAAWTEVAQPVMRRIVTPAPNEKALSFTSLYPQSWPAQVQQLLLRFWQSYNRNIPLNVGRTMALAVLMLIFGVVWYDISHQADSQSGVQSLVAVIFMTSSFCAMINMNVAIPQLLAIRAAFYREQASRMYDPSAFSLGLILTELPWVAFILFASSPIAYFMMHLTSDASTFFFHMLVQYMLSLVYLSMGQALAAAAPTFEVAQATLGFFQPLFFLFGGLFSPVSQMVIGARWFTYIDQILYAFRAIIPIHFWCTGTGCPTIQVVRPNAIITVNRYDYMSQLYEVDFNDRWANIGYLALFFLGYQTLAWLAIRYIRRIVR